MNPWRRISALLAALIITSLAACGGGGDDDDDSGGGGGTFTNEVEDVTYDVSYSDDAVVVESDAMVDVVAVSEDLKTVTLAAGSDTAEGIEEGDVILIAESTFGTVESIEEDGDEVVVTLGDATLNEIIQDGTLAWKDEIHWDELSASSLSESFVQAGFIPEGGLGDAENRPRQEGTPAPTFAVPTGLKFSGMYRGWQVTVELKPTAERLNFTLTAKYQDVVAVTGTGFISNFTEETLLKFEDSQFGEVAVRTTELETEMELKWHAFRRNNAAGLTEVAQFTLPVSLNIPFVIGPIPFTFSIKAVLQVVPAFESEASSGGSWKVNYTSSQGFKVDNTLGGSIGRMTGAQIDTSGETVTSGLGPAGFAVGVEFPRFELSVLKGIAVAFVTLKTYSAGLWTPGTTLSADIPPCQMGYTEVSARYGYQLQILGGAGVSAESEIWKQRTNKFLKDPCSLDGGPAPQDTLSSGPGDSDQTFESNDAPDEEEEDEEEAPSGDAEDEPGEDGEQEGS
jgi:hypothetical protein